MTSETGNGGDDQAEAGFRIDGCPQRPVSGGEAAPEGEDDAVQEDAGDAGYSGGAEPEGEDDSEQEDTEADDSGGAESDGEDDAEPGGDDVSGQDEPEAQAPKSDGPYRPTSG